MSKKQYRKVRVDFGSHPRTRELSGIAKGLMVFLLLPHATGIYTKSIAQMRAGFDRRLSLDTVSSALDELVEAGHVEWDPEFEVVWVVEALDEQVIDGCDRHANWAKHVMAHIATLPPSSLIARLLERYGDWLRRSGIPLGAAPGPTLRVVPSTAERAADGPRTFSEVQAALVQAFSKALGCPVHDGTVNFAMELWQERVATEAELLHVVEWWQANRREAKCDLRWCFARYGEQAGWARISATVLGREPRSRGPKRGSGTRASSIDDVRAAYDRGNT